MKIILKQNKCRRSKFEDNNQYYTTIIMRIGDVCCKNFYFSKLLINLSVVSEFICVIHCKLFTIHD